jgi:hypothetical protein
VIWTAPVASPTAAPPIDLGHDYGFLWEGDLLQLGSGAQAQPVAVFPFTRVGKTGDNGSGVEVAVDRG